jgi:hypothetical protein
MIAMRGSLDASAGVGLAFLLAAVLAGGLPPRSAMAETARPADTYDPRSLPGGADTTRAESPQSPAQEVPPSATEGGGTRLESLLGRELKSRDEDPGRIIDILCDRDGRVRAAVVELGGFLGIGTRRIAVDWTLVKFDGGPKQTGLILDMTRDELRTAADYKPGEPVVYVRRAE